jgi:CP family cyanate transporter-like MFS transporter
MSPSRRPAVVLLIGFVLASLNTRVPFGQVGPLAPIAGIGAGTVTLLGVIPPLGMGLAAPFVPWLLRRFGENRLLLGASVFALAGAGLRPIGVSGLVWGTVIVALAIGVVNVLIPVYVRRRFAGPKAGPVFGVYALAMGGGSALAAAVVVPVGQATGRWELAVATALVPAVLAVVGSVMMLDSRSGSASPTTRHVAATSPAVRIPVSRTWLVWSLMAFFGVQTLLFYALLAWLPSILIAGGNSTEAAGSGQAILILGIALGGFVSPLLAARRVSQTGVITLVVGLSAVGMVGLAFAPTLSQWLWVPLLGLGLGGGQALPAVLYAHRGLDAGHTAALSAFAQTGGFLIAATGPILLSALHAAFTSWRSPLVILAASCVMNLALSWRAGRPQRPANHTSSHKPVSVETRP